MKRIKLNKILLFIALIAFVYNGCKKNDNTSMVVNLSGKCKTTAMFNKSIIYGTMTDQDGNVYKTITIGTQTWMAENLRTTKYRDGSNIPLVTSHASWLTLTTGAYCNYNNTTNCDTISSYGRLYNWFVTSDSRNIAPVGWHVPSEAEWQTLINYLGGDRKSTRLNSSH